MTLVDTGDAMPTGGRLKPIAPSLAANEIFCMTYGDGVEDIDITTEPYIHRAHGERADVVAAAKGNTMLNAAGITGADIAMVADRNVARQNRLFLGSHIPVPTSAASIAYRPKEALIVPRNIAEEAAGELRWPQPAGTRLLAAIPELRTIPCPT